MPRNATAGSYSKCMLSFVYETAKPFSRVAVPFYIPTSHG